MRKSRWPAVSSDADFAPYLTGAPEASVALFWRFISLARAAGPVAFELQNGPVVLCGTRRIFAAIRVSGRRNRSGVTACDRALPDRPVWSHARAEAGVR